MKTYNKKLFLSLFLTLFFIICLNYFINPYNIFKQRIFDKTMLKPEAKVQERYTKPIGLKINSEKIPAIFIGTSRVDLAINKNDYKSFTGMNAENLAVGGINCEEIENMINIALKIHPEIRKIYIGVDFQIFSKDKVKINDNRALITQNPKLEISELCTALLSYGTTGNSFWTIIKNVIGIEKRMFYSDGYKHIFINKDIKDEFDASVYEYNKKYEDYELDYNKITKFKNYVDYLKSEGIEVKLFIMPTHITLQNLIDKTGKRNVYNEWLKELSFIDNVWDFNIKNQYTTEEIKPDMKYFFDGSHSTHIFGKMITEDLLSDNPKYAVLRTSCNGEKYEK